MAAPFQLGEVHYSAESAFAENAEAASSNTYTHRILTLGVPDHNPMQNRDPDGSIRSRMDEEGLPHIGVREGEVSFTTYLVGHGGTAAGALTETFQQDLISDGLGGGNTASVGTTISGAGSTATAINVTAGTTFSAGGACRIGVKGDARGDGQFLIIGTITDASPDVLNLLTAAPAAPTTNGDVVYAVQVAYHDESAALANTLGTKRFMVGHTTAGTPVHYMGCQLAGLKLEFPLEGGTSKPTVTYRYRAAYWDHANVTIPSSSPSASAADCQPVSGGSMFINDVGTATRATITPGRISLDLELGLEPIYGPGGNGTYQHIVGWQRTVCKPTLTVDLPWSTATTYKTWWDTANSSIAYKHILFTASAVNGRAVGFYMPRVMPYGNRPSRVINVNGQQYATVQFRGVSGATTTSELTRSAIRILAG